MAEMTPVNITIDEEALRAQVEGAIGSVLSEVAWKLMSAANALDPTIQEAEKRWLEQEVQRRVDRLQDAVD